MSAPAISRHLRTLEASGLVVRPRQGRHHVLALDAARANHASGWTASLARLPGALGGSGDDRS